MKLRSLSLNEQKRLAQLAAVVEGEVAHAADLVARLAALDMAFSDTRMPFVVPIEIAGVGPDLLHRQVDNVADIDLGHFSPLVVAASGDHCYPRSGGNGNRGIVLGGVAKHGLDCSLRRGFSHAANCTAGALTPP